MPCSSIRKRRRPEFAADVEPLDGRYPVIRQPNGRLRVLRVPIFAAHTRDGKTIDTAWLDQAVERAAARKRGGYLARLHVGHHGTTPDPEGVGFLDDLNRGIYVVNGRVTPVIFADFADLSDRTYRRLLARELPYVSVEIGNEPEIASAALLHSEPPYFKFPLITVREPAASAALAYADPGGPASPAAVLRWRTTMPDETTNTTATPPQAGQHADPAVAPAGGSDMEARVAALEAGQAQIMEALAAISGQLDASASQEMAEKTEPIPRPAETRNSAPGAPVTAAEAAGYAAEVTALKAKVTALETDRFVEDLVGGLVNEGRAIDPETERKTIRRFAEAGEEVARTYVEQVRAKVPVAPPAAGKRPAAPSPADTVAALPDGPEKWKKEYAMDASLQQDFRAESTYLAHMRAEQRRKAKRGRVLLPVLALLLALALVAWVAWPSAPMPVAEAALSANAPITVAGGDRAQHLLTAGSKVYAGSALGMQATGYVRALTAGDRFVGHAAEYRYDVDSTGTMAVTCYTGNYRFLATFSSIAITDVGKAVFATDDATYVIDPANGSSSRVGKLVQYVSSTSGWVECDTYGHIAEGLIYALDAAGTACTNTTDETVLASFDIPANALQVGDVIEVMAGCIATSTSDSDTLTLKLYADTEELAASDATDVSNNNIGFFHAYVTVRAVGASGNITAMGTYVKTLAAEGTAANLPFMTNAATEATNATFTISVKGTWSAADTDNSCRCDSFAVWIHRAR